MTQKQATDMILQNLPAIYGYAFERLYDKEKTEDLASEIVCEILLSAKNLKNEDAFWGFVWKIAENTFRKFIRREKLAQRSGQFDFDYKADVSSAENEYIKHEEQKETIYLLRRELSLLSKVRREVCVAYYIDNKSCSQIAREQNISAEMVKYHLFKTRKLLKEGLNMTRTLGEKSYNPGTFRIDFWGDWNRYNDLFDRKLPGSVMLAAYHAPMSAEEISVELGVSMPYLEDEIEILEAAGLINKVGNKYRTNIVIITDGYEKEFVKATSSVYKNVAGDIYEKAKALLPQIRNLDFHGNTYDDNRLLFAILNMALVSGYKLTNELSPLGTPKKLALGGSGWVFGYDNDYLNHHFYGVTMDTWNKAWTAWFSAVNYRIIKECQLYDNSYFSEKTEAMCDAVLGKNADKANDTLPWLIENGFIICADGKLSANFPVFEEKLYLDIIKMLEPIVKITANCMIDISDQAERMLKERVPASVKDQCGDIAKIHHRLDVMAFIIESLIADNKLIIPNEKTPLCVWGVRD